MCKGSNRSGKTVWLCVSIAIHVTKLYPKWWKGHRLEGPVKVRVIGSDFVKHIGGVLVPELLRWLPKKYIVRKKKNQNGVIIFFELLDGSTIELMSSGEDVELFEGWSGHILAVDEPQDRNRYIAAKRGLIDYGGFVLLSLTPLKSAWVYDDIECKAVSDPSIKVFELWIDENPTLTEEAIEEYFKGLKPDEIQARRYGKYLHLEGIVYKEFDPSVHIIEPFPNGIPKHWNHFCILDPHDKIANMLLWAAMDETGDIIFYAESFIDSLTIQMEAESIKFRERRAGAPIRRRIIDPNFGRKIYGNTNKTVKDEYRIAGSKIGYPLVFHDAIDDIAAGHAAVKEYLYFDKEKPLSMDNHPKVYFYDTLKETNYAFMHYMYKKKRNEDTSIQMEGKPAEEHKHAMDCVRYLLVERPQYRSMRDEVILPYEQRRPLTSGGKPLTSRYYR